MSKLSIEQLKDKKEKLLREKNARVSLMNFSKQRDLERKKLKADINALENPRSAAARRTAIKISVKSGKLAFKAALGLGRHLMAVSAEQNKPVRKKRKVMKKPMKRKMMKKTKKRKRK